MTEALYVAKQEQLDDTLHRLAGADFIALDTEFMREDTFFPKLCLIQAATPDFTALIDPLTLDDLNPLWGFLHDRSRTKVLHAARQDLEVLLVAMGEAPLCGPVFDTQIAAALLGLPAQVGYGSLVAQRLGHTLAKGHARTDWTRRPLSGEQRAYAADDARFLAPLYLDLRSALEQEGRLSWLYEETRELEEARLYRSEPDEAWRRLKGLERMQPAQRATAKLLASWRETLAMKSDKPRGWILADEALRELAERRPASVADLEQLRGLPPAVIRKRGPEILALVEQATALAANEAAASAPARPDPQQVAKVTRLMAYVRAEGERLKVSPELLATRRDIEALVFSGRSARLSTGWRKEVIGARLATAG